MTEPHDNWSKYYDFVYERTFGNFYNNLTSETIRTIKGIIQKGTIIDFGAGTGRLSIPLSSVGYEIIAVEKSVGMVEELQNKMREQSLEFPIHNASISNYNNGMADLSLALFTVLSYSVSEEELNKNIKNISSHLSSNGFFFFDFPNSVFFNTGQIINIKTEDFNRSVSIMPRNQKDTYIYNEKCSGFFNGAEFNYEDEFLIRYWSSEFFDKVLRNEGFTLINSDFPQFNGTGSTYKLYQKT